MNSAIDWCYSGKCLRTFCSVIIVGLSTQTIEEKSILSPKLSLPFTAGRAVTNRDVMLIIFTRCGSSKQTIELVRDTKHGIAPNSHSNKLLAPGKLANYKLKREKRESVRYTVIIHSKHKSQTNSQILDGLSAVKEEYTKCYHVLMTNGWKTDCY